MGSSAPSPGEAHAADPVRLLVRRLAHDLATPLGALAVAIELDREADPLLREAVSRLTLRLDLQRALFGAPADAPFDPSALGPLLEPIVLRIATVFDPHGSRALAALALDAAPLLAGKGVIVFDRTGECPELRLEGRVSEPSAALAAVLAGGPPTEPGHVGAALAVHLLGTFVAQAHDTGLTLRARAPR